MLRCTFFLYMVLCTLSVFGQDQEIYWRHDFQLDWSDFQQRVGQGGIFKAFTYSGIRYEVRDIGGVVHVDIESYFLPDESWAFKDFLSKELLAHEELHFHITEIFARKMRRHFAKYEIDVETFSAENQIEDLKREYNSIYDEMEVMQKRYDAETDHGIVEQAQIDWEDWIDVQLKMTDSFAKAKLD